MAGGSNAHIYTVTELTRDVRLVLEDAFTGIWVEGEISNLRLPVSGHAYFTLKDENSMLKCVLFKSAGSRLKFALEDGMRVSCFGRVSVYDKQGQYQLYADIIELQGKGALYAAFEQLKERLRKEGLFDEARKKPVPFLPVRLGVITSGTGAAVRDILKVARRRFTNIEITISPVKVQGDDAKHEIAQAIELMNEYNRYLANTGSKEHPIEVIIAGRGGGSMEDLWAFNEEIVARAIFASEIPVISAVGHEIDYTISDFTADHRAATPSAAAELVIPEKDELRGRIDGYTDRLGAAVSSRLDLLGTRLKNLSDSYVMRAPVNAVLQLEQQVDDLARRARVGITHHVELQKSGFAMLAGKLKALGPLSVLNRGYSITFQDGRVVRDTEGLRPGDRLLTRFARDEVSSRVEEVRRKNERHVI
ncbi:MAG: exodeoxyribonuclease VII large subunit [Candidatus Omnitrophica bacterium]|nr:exodeoxyribonuclease VII large subunit [Candidatus Omnitrophota bacterium]